MSRALLKCSDLDEGTLGQLLVLVRRASQINRATVTPHLHSNAYGGKKYPVARWLLTENIPSSANVNCYLFAKEIEVMERTVCTHKL